MTERPTTGDAAALLIAAAARAPFALFWGPGCVIRRTLHSFIWGPEPTFPSRLPPRTDFWQISCEPPCYGCQPYRCRRG